MERLTDEQRAEIREVAAVPPRPARAFTHEAEILLAWDSDRDDLSFRDTLLEFGELDAEAYRLWWAVLRGLPEP